jgi:hypothetical protein
VDEGKENIKGNVEYANAITREFQGHDCKIRRNVKRRMVGNASWHCGANRSGSE